MSTLFGSIGALQSSAAYNRSSHSQVFSGSESSGEHDSVVRLTVLGQFREWKDLTPGDAGRLHQDVAAVCRVLLALRTTNQSITTLLPLFYGVAH